MSNKWWRTSPDIIFLAALFWTARYWHSAHFGLYEDDITRIPEAIQMSGRQLAAYLSDLLIQFGSQGRPLHPALIFLFSNLGWRSGGLWGMYWVGFLVGVINIALCYWLVRRATDRNLALLAGISYALFSADTTQAFLTHSLGVQPSITLLLLAAHAYLSNRRILAYSLAILILFSYETAFLPFLAVPLFKKEWDKSLLKELLRHLVILVVMLGGVLFLRSMMGEGRVANLALEEMLTVPLLHTIQGPLVSLGTFIVRPLQAIRGINSEIAVASMSTFGVLLFLFSRLQIEPTVGLRKLWLIIRDPEARREAPERVRVLGRMFVAGAALLILAYPLTFTLRAYAISGRGTRVHTAGMAGAAILMSCLIYLLLVLAQNRWRILANIALAGYFSLLVGYGFVIQRDYVLAWQYQKDFWAELLPLIPDAVPGTVVLVEPSGLRDTRQIGAVYWNLPRVLRQLYIFPPSDKPAPHVNRLNPGWAHTLGRDNGLLVLNGKTGLTIKHVYGDYPSTKVIFTETYGGRLARRTGPLILNGQEYPLKPLSAPFLPQLLTTLLHDLFIEEPLPR